MSPLRLLAPFLGSDDREADSLCAYPYIWPGQRAPEFEVYFRRGAGPPIAWRTLLSDTWISVQGRRLQWLSYPRDVREAIRSGQAVSWRVSLGDKFMGFDAESHESAEKDAEDLMREGAREVVFHVAGLTTAPVRYAWSTEDQG